MNNNVRTVDTLSSLIHRIQNYQILSWYFLFQWIISEQPMLLIKTKIVNRLIFQGNI